MKKLVIFILSVLLFPSFLTATVDNQATLWITDLKGTIHSTNFLDINGSYAYGCATNNSNAYIVALGTVNRDPTNLNATLWITNLVTSLASKVMIQTTTHLDSTLGSRPSGCAVNSTHCYTVGPPDTTQYGDFLPQATLWITDLNGNNLQTTPLNGSAQDTYAYSCTANTTNCFIAGYGFNGSNKCPTLWITDVAGSMIQHTIYLYTGDTLGHSSASGCAVNSANCYISGQKTSDSDQNLFNATLWITNLDGSSPRTITLDSNNDTYATCCAVSNSSCYMAGVGYNSTTQSLVSTLWITDLNGNLKNTIYLDKAPYSAGTGCAVNDTSCYVVGQGSSNNSSILWITDLNGSNQKTTILDANTSFTTSCAIGGNYLYITGQESISSAAKLLDSVRRHSLLKPQQ